MHESFLNVKLEVQSVDLFIILNVLLRAITDAPETNGSVIESMTCE